MTIGATESRSGSRVDPGPGASSRQPIRRAWTALCCVFILAATPVWSRADTQPLHDYAFSFTFENDLFFGADKYYTDGVQLTIKRRPDRRADSTRAALDFVCAHFGCANDDFQTSHFRVGQLMYTPRNIAIAAPQPLDRPWAGMLYLASDYQYLSPDDTRLTTITGEVGLIGPQSRVEQTQKWIHKTFTGVPPQGWDNQIGNELGLLAAVERRYALAGIAPAYKNAVELRTNGHWRLAVGNIMTYAGAGFSVVVGKNLPKVSPRESGSIVDKRTQGAGLASVDDQRSGTNSCLFDWLRCTAFASVEARLMARNVFLDGPLFRDGPSVKRRPVVADVSVGARFDLTQTRSDGTGPWFIQFKATRRTPEFRSSASLKAQKFGALTIGTEF